MSATVSQRGQSGLSLVEVMVVLVIASLSAAIVIGMPGAPGGSLREEADRLAISLSDARDRAITSNRSVRLEFDENGYILSIRDQRAWRALDGTRSSVQWGPGTRFVATGSSTDARAELHGVATITFDAIGLTDPTVIRLQREAASESVKISGAGEIMRGERYDAR